MTTTRVLVAHDAGARTFEHRGPGKGLVELGRVPFEDGRRHTGELDSDRPGRTFDRGSASRSAYEPHQDAKQHAIAHFAKQLALELWRDYRNGAFSQLVLIAPPRFLGVLRDALDHKLVRVVIGTVAKDLPRADAAELSRHVACFMAV